MYTLSLHDALPILDRKKLISKLQNMIGNLNPLTVIVKNILAYNQITIDHTIYKTKEITQTNGVLQGDPISPILFKIATTDVITTIRERSKDAVIYMYADDMVLRSPNKEELQRIFLALVEWAGNNSLKINWAKTQQMVFRKGGCTAADDNLQYEEDKVEIVNSFKYLGITLQTTGTFRLHIKDKALAAMKAMYDINNLQHLSLKTAMRLFDTKILPVLTYGIHLIWEKLTKKELANIEGVKAKFLKTIMGISKYTRSA
jgi:hypothetical protein